MQWLRYEVPNGQLWNASTKRPQTRLILAICHLWNISTSLRFWAPSTRYHVRQIGCKHCCSLQHDFARLLPRGGIYSSTSWRTCFGQQNVAEVTWRQLPKPGMPLLLFLGTCHVNKPKLACWWHPITPAAHQPPTRHVNEAIWDGQPSAHSPVQHRHMSQARQDQPCLVQRAEFSCTDLWATINAFFFFKAPEFGVLCY